MNKAEKMIQMMTLKQSWVENVGTFTLPTVKKNTWIPWQSNTPSPHKIQPSCAEALLMVASSAVQMDKVASLTSMMKFSSSSPETHPSVPISPSQQSPDSPDRPDRWMMWTNQPEVVLTLFHCPAEAMKGRVTKIQPEADPDIVMIETEDKEEMIAAKKRLVDLVS